MNSLSQPPQPTEPDMALLYLGSLFETLDHTLPRLSATRPSSMPSRVTPAWFLRMIQRTGRAAKLPFQVHPHMLRHSTGYKLANDGQDTRSLAHYLGHRNLQSTARYTALAPDRFAKFWKD
jgi:type 1 fimbriae regulatory protein FimE